MQRLRVSAISFLNTAPLMWDFDHGELRHQYEVSYTLPSACAETLRIGTADIGIIPAITYQTIPDLVVIPQVAIASKGAVRSIVLVCKTELDKISRVALDTSSRTSVALTKILFQQYWRQERAQPEFIPHDPDLKRMLRHADAALLIGDPALLVDNSQYQVFDLAAEWKRFTGKPFVFAFWAVRREALPSSEKNADLCKHFQQSRDHGLVHIKDLAREWAPRVRLSDADVTSYLTENIDYSLDAENLSGLRLFFDKSVECGILPALFPLDFL